jgi:hypothetical protein
MSARKQCCAYVLNELEILAVILFSSAEIPYKWVLRFQDMGHQA